MIKKLLILASLLFAVFISTDAQEMSVKSFEYLPKDLTARTSARNDRNGTPCAVIRVGIALQGVVFDGNTIDLPVYNTGEYLVYMTEGSRQITIRHDNYVPLTVVFADYGIDKVESSNTYRLTVLTGGLNADQQAQGNFLVMSVTPPTSRVIIDEGEPTAVKADGTLKTYLNNGHHRYRVEAEGYMPQSGTLSMSGARQQITIALQSSKAALTVKTTTSGSKIYINEDYKGTDSWQGELTPGTYLVEARKDGFRSSTKTVTLAKQQTESITLPALQQIFGSMMVDYEPVDAEVYLDNNLIGKSPNVFTNIAAGKHNIKISKAGYADYTGSVTIPENQQASVCGSLTKGSTLASSSNAQANISSTNTINGHEWVDLGLSVKWATKNVGASSPSDYGYHFAWGETRKKDNYDWKTCFDCLDSMGDSWGTYKIGGKTSISPTSGHDTARENWGGTWRMPTDAEFEELCKKCDWTWTSQGGHNGYLVTSKTNGNSIFLPAAGWRFVTDTYYVGERGGYWSGTLSSSLSNGARILNFYSSYHGTDDSSRSVGLSVRPVTE